MRVEFIACLGLLPLLACDGSLTGAATCQTQSYTIGVAASGTIADGDCKDSNNSVGDVYEFTLSAPTNFELTMSPTGFSGNLMLQKGLFSSGSKVLIFEVIGSGKIGAKAYLPAGSYAIIATTATDKGGDYRIESQLTESAGCSPYFNYTLPGVQIRGTITNDDCGGSGPGRQEAYSLWMTSGQTVAVTATLDKSGAVLWRYGDSNTPDLITRNMSQAGSTQFNFTAPRNDGFRVHVQGAPSVTGPVNYTVSIQ